MPTIPMSDRFLGSLIGAYYGSGYSNHQQANGHSIQDSSNYQAWLNQPWPRPELEFFRWGKQQVSAWTGFSIQQTISTAPTSLELNSEISSELNLATAIPWLLYYHDDRQKRHSWLAKGLESPPSRTIHAVIDTAQALFLLGDSLEWLMQSSPTIQNPRSLLYEHLQQQLSIYPHAIVSDVQPLLQTLGTQSLHIGNEAAANPYGDTSTGTVALALDQGLNHRENLALALAHSMNMGSLVHQIIGCLLGAWGGTYVIPPRWVMALQNKSDNKHTVIHVAEQLYRKWAGIINVSSTCETFPLDL